MSVTLEGYICSNLEDHQTYTQSFCDGFLGMMILKQIQCVTHTSQRVCDVQLVTHVLVGF